MLGKVAKWVYLNGRIVSKDKALISAFDRGFLFADALAETMRSYFLKVPFIEEHFDRLRRGMETLGFRSGLDLSQFCSLVYSLLNKNRTNSICVRFTVSRGVGSEIAVGEKTLTESNIFCFLREIPESLSAMHNLGIHAATSAPQRGFEETRALKSTNYLESVLARQSARRAQADDMIFLDTEGNVTESTTANVFLVRGNELITPASGRNVLGGVTRRKILGLAREAGLSPVERSVPKAELFSADEVFLSNSVIELVSVTTLDGKRVGQGRPGRAARALHELYQRLIESCITAGDSPHAERGAAG